jgi:fido (protein-threonine AMPylation protein)|tara:strand:- start:427 stop:594 length:168 start_codon:yes stop_codon:yes gene_type:complete
MSKTWDYKGTGRKSSFSQKKKELNEYEDLVSSGYIDEINNKKRIRLDLEYLEEDV